jgi:hypothetical protein
VSYVQTPFGSEVVSLEDFLKSYLATVQLPATDVSPILDYIKQHSALTFGEERDVTRIPVPWLAIALFGAQALAESRRTAERLDKLEKAMNKSTYQATNRYED